jgi:hypothetical protein
MPEKIMNRFKAIAREMPDLWRFIFIDKKGNVQKHPLMTQDEVLQMFPEINPRFFHNFGVVELTIRQDNGNQIKLVRVR